MERVNFASERLGDLESPGVEAIVDRILGSGDGELSGEEMVDGAFDELSLTAVSDKTRSALLDFAEAQVASDDGAREQVANVLKLASATPEFQRA